MRRPDLRGEDAINDQSKDRARVCFFYVNLLQHANCRCRTKLFFLLIAACQGSCKSITLNIYCDMPTAAIILKPVKKPNANFD
jgi:hypothetical protein